MVYDNSHLLTLLRRQWLYVTLLYATILALGYGMMLQVWPAADAVRWLLLAVVTMVVQMVVLRWALRFNHSPEGGALFPDLGLANAMTLARGLLTCLMAGFLFGPAPQGWVAWVPALLYMTERVIDFFDGFVARYTGRETRLGAILDIEFDGLGILIAVGLGIQYGHLPFWYLLLGLGRQLFVFGMWILQRMGKPVYDLSPSEHRRVIAGFQTGFISIVLWPLWSPQTAMFAAWLFAVPLIFSFGRDWLVVSGAIDANSARYQEVRSRAKRLFEQWLPPVVRLVGALVSFWMLWQGAGLPISAALLTGAAALLLLIGVAGRTAALILAFVAGLSASTVGLRWDNALLMLCAVYILHLGSGLFALWQPEEYYLHTKLGSREEAGA